MVVNLDMLIKKFEDAENLRANGVISEDALLEEFEKVWEMARSNGIESNLDAALREMAIKEMEDVISHFSRSLSEVM